MKTLKNKCTTAIVLCLLGVQSDLFSQTLDENLWATDNPVYSIVRSGDTIYIAGCFTYVGPNTGGGAAIDIETGSLLSAFPRLNGNVFAVVSDGEGGWYIGGEFTKVGGLPRTNLAQISSDGSVTEWNPTTNGTVMALEVYGSCVYIGGSFTAVNGEERRNLAAVEEKTGALVEWDPSANSQVFCIQAANSQIYVGGAFTFLGSYQRNRLAAVDPTTGVLTNWNPGIDGERVQVIRVGDPIVYVGGIFESVGGESRPYLAAIDASTGVPTAWNPEPDGPVFCMAINKETAYIGGAFGKAGGETRENLAALDISTGFATKWNPGTTLPVTGLAVSGSYVYVAGGFRGVAGQGRRGLAAIHFDGTLKNWTPGTDAGAYTLCISGSTVYVGGGFRVVNGVDRYRLASLDATTGAVTNWNPHVDGAPLAMPPTDSVRAWVRDSLGRIVWNAEMNQPQVNEVALQGPTLYVGGDFTRVGGQVRNGLAAVDKVTGTVLPWNPGLDGPAQTLAVIGPTVFIGGYFTTLGGQARNRIGAVDAQTGSVHSWDPNANSTVLSLGVSGGRIYLGGYFTSVGGYPRNYLAAVDSVSGNVVPGWNPNPNDWVYDIALTDSRMYIGGEFTSVGSAQRSRIAEIDLTTGDPTDWVPDAITGGHDPTTRVMALAVSSSLVYAGGNFAVVGGSNIRYNLCGLDRETGNVTDWTPDATYPTFIASEVHSLASFEQTVYVGGFFTDLGGGVAHNFGAVTASGVKTVSTPTVAGWQTLSVPVRVLDFSTTAVWPEASSAAFEFVPGEGYIVRDVLENGPGYYVEFAGSGQVDVTGEELPELCHPVSAGWNLEGSLTYPIPVEDVGLTPQTNEFRSPFFVFQNGYNETNTIIPGMGHWIKVSENGSILFSNAPSQKPIFGMSGGKGLDPPLPNDVFTVSDASGGLQELRITNGGSPVDMPPPPPNGAFNVRFSSGRFQEAVSLGQGLVSLPIELASVTYPIRVTWRLEPATAISYWIRNGVQRDRLARTGSITINQRVDGTVRLEGQVDRIHKSEESILPQTYALQGVFPNPFNPSTKFRFDLPDPATVSLAVYDLLGRKVADLVSGHYDAGYHSAVWNAPDLASGVYLARINISNAQGGVVFTQAKKLLLMK